MSHDHDSQKKYEIAIHALVPLVTMLFVQMLLNYTTAPANMIFISPYLLAFWVALVISIFVLWKGQICPGQAGRLLFVFKFLPIRLLSHQNTFQWQWWRLPLFSFR